MRNTDNVPRSQTIVLTHGQAITLSKPRRGSWLVCARGTIWITEPGDARDHLLREGERRVLASRRGTVVSAIGAAELRVVAGRRLSAAYPATVTACVDC